MVAIDLAGLGDAAVDDRAWRQSGLAGIGSDHLRLIAHRKQKRRARRSWQPYENESGFGVQIDWGLHRSGKVAARKRDFGGLAAPPSQRKNRVCVWIAADLETVEILRLI